MHIERHPLKNAQMFQMILDGFYGRIEAMLENLTENTTSLGTNIQEVINCIGYAVALEKDPKEIGVLLDLGTAIATANFVSTTLPDEDYTISFKGKKYDFVRAESTAYTGVDSWCKAFYLAVITRNGESIRILSQVSSTHLKEANLKGTPFDYAYVDFLKGIYDASADIGDLLIAAMEASDPSQNSADTQEYILNLQVPELAVYRCVFSSEQEEFNEKLAELLKNHKDFWSQKNKAMDVKGWISLPAMAAAVIAFGGKDFEIGVTSDYMPEWIVKGQW